jgi:signal transduction histidine kinase
LKVEIKGDWPEIITTSVLLDLVLRNLLDNAIKHHDRDIGQISLIAERIEAFLVVVINDDGPGIPARHREAILRPFAKIDLRRPESSGMGLSMVHKVIGEIGGQLDVGDRLDSMRGTRIAVSWPLNLSDC